MTTGPMTCQSGPPLPMALGDDGLLGGSLKGSPGETRRKRCDGGAMPRRKIFMVSMYGGWLRRSQIR